MAVVKEITKIQSAFLWGDNEQGKKMHMVKWDVVSKSTKAGGLGIKKIRDLNITLLLKW